MSKSFVFFFLNMNSVLACSSKRAILNPFKRLMTSWFYKYFKTTTLVFVEETLVPKWHYLLIQFRVIKGNRVDGIAEIWLDKDGYLKSELIKDFSGIRVLRNFYLGQVSDKGSLSYDHPLYEVREILEENRNERDSLICRNLEKMKSGNSTIEYKTFVVPFEKDTLVSSEPFLLHEDIDSDSYWTM